MYNYGYSSLYHHGIKGMKWGVRKQKETKRERYLRIADEKMTNRRNYLHSSVDRLNSRIGTDRNIKKAGSVDKMVDRNRVLEENLRKSEDRMVALGKTTLTKQRVNVALHAAASVSLGVIAAAATGGSAAIPAFALGTSLGAIPAAASGTYINKLIKR